MKILANFGDYTHTKERREQNTYGGVGYYRIAKPMQYVEGHDVKVIGREIVEFGNTLEEQWWGVFAENDVYWTNYFADDRAGAAIAYYKEQLGKKFIVDVDDNYLDVPESNLLYDRFKPGKRERAMLGTILSFADAVTVSTEPLKERLEDHFKTVYQMEKKIVVIPNMNDIKDWDYTPAEKHTDKVVIGYSGSNSHHDDLKMCMPAIGRVMAKHKHVYLEMIGAVAKEAVPELFKTFTKDAMDRCILLPATPTFKEYPEWLSQQRWDIGIAPLVDTAFTRSKSHIKWMEYAVYGIPCVASRVYPYQIDLYGRKTVKDGKTGFLVRSPEWESTLEKLILSKTLREEIGKNAKKAVIEDWQYDSKLITSLVNEALN